MNVATVMMLMVLGLSSCVVEESFEQRVRSCDPSLATDEQALHYHDNDNHNILMMASEVGCLALVKSLVKKIDVNERTRIGTTALFSAVESENPEIVRFLINKNIDVNAAEWLGDTGALGVAVSRGNLGITKILLAAGANPNHRGRQLGSTPLHFAVISQRYALVELLLKYGADPKIKAKGFGTALGMAKKKADKRMLELLMTQGRVNGNYPNQWGQGEVPPKH